jgi:hypothetical protein
MDTSRRLAHRVGKGKRGLLSNWELDLHARCTYREILSAQLHPQSLRREHNLELRVHAVDVAQGGIGILH